MKIKYFTLLVVLQTLLIVKCSDNQTDPSKNSSLLSIKVVDNAGNPLENIKISLWSIINPPSSLPKMNPANYKMFNINASSTIEFNLPMACYSSLKSYDLNGKEQYILFDHKSFNAGSYQIVWRSELYNGVYKCKLISSSDSLQKDIIFQDSIYVVLIAPIPQLSTIGTTDKNGLFETNEKLLFPYLFNLPKIPGTSYSPDTLNLFEFVDSVIVALSDESFNNSITYTIPINPNRNNFTLKYYQTGFGKSVNNDKRLFDNSINIVKDTILIPLTWELYQNFPNPFY